MIHSLCADASSQVAQEAIADHECLKVLHQVGPKQQGAIPDSATALPVGAEGRGPTAASTDVQQVQNFTAYYGICFRHAC